MFHVLDLEARKPGGDVHVTTCLFRSPGARPAGRESEVDNLSGLAGTASSSPRLFPPARARPLPSLPPSGLQTWWARTLTVGGRLVELTQ